MEVQIVNTRTAANVKNILDFTPSQRSELNNAIINKLSLNEKVTDANLLTNIKPFLSYVAQWFSMSYSGNDLASNKLYSIFNSVEVPYLSGPNGSFKFESSKDILPAVIPFASNEIIIATKGDISSTGQIGIRNSLNEYIGVISNSVIAVDGATSVDYTADYTTAKEIVIYIEKNDTGQIRMSLYLDKSKEGRTDFIKVDGTDFMLLRLREIFRLFDFIVFSGFDLSEFIGANGSDEATIQNTDFNILMSNIESY